MSSDKINLEEILQKELIPTVFEGSSELTFNATIKAMKEACRQILELAAENAKINWVENNVKMESDTDFSFRDNDGNWCKININEQSILNTIKQVK